MEKKRKGIYRHESLRPLSHHHTNALHMALKLNRAGTDKSKLTLQELQQEAEDFWNPDGMQHFRDEEEILLTAFAQHASVDIPEVHDMLLEHVQIRALFDTIIKAEKPDASVMNQLGEMLEKHIRKEERTLFPMIEKALPEDILEEVAPHLH